MSEEPTRLLDDTSADPTLRADLRHATGVKVDGLDTVAGLLALRLAVGSQAGATASAGMSGAMKIGVATVVAAGVLALWLGTRPNEPEPASVAPTAVEPAEPPVAGGGAPEPPPVPELPAAAPEPPEEEPVLAEEPPAVEPEAAPTDEHRATHKPHHKPAAHHETPPASTERFLREAKLVAEARRALGGNPSGALALTQEIAREFPQGQLVEEREALAIRALAALGRKDAATKRATRFLKRYSHGPHADAVRAAIE